MSDRRIKITLLLGQDDLTTITRSQQLAQITVDAKNCALPVGGAESAADSLITIVLKEPEVKPQLQGLCLCCRMHTELSDLLREAFMQAIQRKRPPFTHVLICARSDTDPANIVHTLSNDFFLKERFVYQDAVYFMGEGEQRAFAGQEFDGQSSASGALMAHGLVDDEFVDSDLGQEVVLSSNVRYQLLAADLILLDGGGGLIEGIQNYLAQANRGRLDWFRPKILLLNKLTETEYINYSQELSEINTRIEHRRMNLFL